MLDTGDAVTGGGILGDQTQGEAIVAGMNLMGYDAMAVGPRELLLGVDLLRQRVAAAEFPMLSANVVLSGTEDLVAEPYTILEVGDHQVGVIGLTRVPANARPGFQVLDPREAAARYVPEVAEKAGTIIVLTNLSSSLALKLAGAVPGIDLVIAARPEADPKRMEKAPETGTPVVSAELPVRRHTGRWVGRLAVMVESDGTFFGPAWLRQSLTREIADDPQMRDLLNKYRQ